jgi:hypothetical protein
MLHRTFTFSRNTSKRHTPQNIQPDKHAKLGGYVTATIQLHLQAGQDLLWIRRIRIRSGVAASAVVPELPAHLRRRFAAWAGWQAARAPWQRSRRPGGRDGIRWVDGCQPYLSIDVYGCINIVVSLRIEKIQQVTSIRWTR